MLRMFIIRVTVDLHICCVARFTRHLQVAQVRQRILFIASSTLPWLHFSAGPKTYPEGCWLSKYRPGRCPATVGPPGEERRSGQLGEDELQVGRYQAMA